MSRNGSLMVKEDRRAFPSSSSELDDDDDTELVRRKPLKPNLRWKDSSFQEQTLAAFHQMRKHKHFCDVTLQLGKQDFPAHRVILAAASPYFMELFTTEEDQPTRKEMQGGILYELNGGFTKEALEKLIDYAYTARLDVPSEYVKPVYLAAMRLKMDRAAAECARFLASHLDLGSCLEIRSTPGVTTNSKKVKSAATSDSEESRPKERKNSKESTAVTPTPTTTAATTPTAAVKNGSYTPVENGAKTMTSLETTENGVSGSSEAEVTSEKVEGEQNGDCQENGGKADVDLVSEVDKFIAANVGLLHDSRQLRALPRLQIEVLHACKEEREAALIQPLCELILDWSQKQWLDDGELTLDNFTSKRYLLFLAADNTLQDCDVIAEGSAIDSEIIQDYKKGNRMHLQLNPNKNSKKQRRLVPTVKPAKPREMLYTRHINQHEEGDDTVDEWKIIASHKLDDQSILAIASLDGQLATLSINQRINKPTDPSGNLIHSIDSMSRSVSNVSLADGLSVKSRSPRVSRPESIEKESFVPVAFMSQAKCAVGAECLQGKLLVCGGYDRGECLNSVELYDADTNLWTALPSMKHNRGRFDITCVDGNIVYAVAGSNGQAEISSVEKFDFKEGKWSKCAPLPVALSNVGVCNLGGAVYCIGGTHGPSGTKYCFRYSIEENTWERIANLNIGRFQAAVCSFQGRIFAVGGCDGWNPLNTVEVYEPATNTWKMGPPLTTPRRGGGIAVRNGKLILVGGNDGTHSLCTTEILDPYESTWAPGPTMTTCRTNVSVAMVDNRLWAVGGFSGKSFLNTIEYLDPVTDEWTTFIPVDVMDFPKEGDDHEGVVHPASSDADLLKTPELEAVQEVSEEETTAAFPVASAAGESSSPTTPRADDADDEVSNAQDENASSASTPTSATESCLVDESASTAPSEVALSTTTTTVPTATVSDNTNSPE